MINVPYKEFWLSSTYHIDKKYNFLEANFFFRTVSCCCFFVMVFLMGFFTLKNTRELFLND